MMARKISFLLLVSAITFCLWCSLISWPSPIVHAIELQSQEGSSLQQQQSNNNKENSKQEWRFVDYLGSGSNDIRDPATITDLENEDHSNIELDKLNEFIKYNTDNNIDGSSTSINSNPTNLRERSSLNSNLARLLARILYTQQQQQRASQLLRTNNVYERKRSVRQLANSKEDKDYSFVGASSLLPTTSTEWIANNNNNNKFLTNFGLANQLLRSGNLGSGRDPMASATSASRLQQRLRDILLENGQQQQAVRYANEQDQQPIQLRSGSFGSEMLTKNNMDNNNNAIDVVVVPKTARDKRRRCKSDPNLGVKSPVSCDTDAYFGAADYSMRDVWDSAGRR